MTAAAKKTAATLLEKQAGIEKLRKAVREGKTRLSDIRRNVKDCSAWLAQDQNQSHLVGLIAEYKTKQAAAETQLDAAVAELNAALAALPAVKESEFAAVLRWFSGSSLVKAKDALELLDASLEHGSWIPGVSRKVYAALGKANVAKKTVKVDRSYNASKANTALSFAIQYGSFERLAALDLSTALSELNNGALDYYADFWPLVQVLARLDATRPVPTFTILGVSPTLTATLKAYDAVLVEVCPLKYETVERKDAKTGKTVYETVVTLLWPEGTIHNSSKFAYGTNNNSQCHACGHAIKNSFNWVPLVLTDRAGGKKSLWVGRDCAESLFGVKLVGELELAPGSR